MRHADVVVLMTARNVEFFKTYYPELKPEFLIHPPWGRRRSDDPRARPSRGAFVVVFGGQLARGRGVETLIEATRLLKARGVDVEVRIVGSGPGREELQTMAATVDAVTFVDRVPRQEYLSMLADADCGVAVTVSDVSVPTFPSKVVDYARIGLPFVVALEESTDAGVLVERNGGGISVPAGDPKALADALNTLVRERDRGVLTERSRRSRELFDSEFDAAAIARALISQAIVARA